MAISVCCIFGYKARPNNLCNGNLVLMKIFQPIIAQANSIQFSDIDRKCEFLSHLFFSRLSCKSTIVRMIEVLGFTYLQHGKVFEAMIERKKKVLWLQFLVLYREPIQRVSVAKKIFFFQNPCFVKLRLQKYIKIYLSN